MRNNKVKQKSFLKEYIDEMTKQIKLVRPEISEVEIRKIVKEKCKEKYKNPTVKIDEDEMPLDKVINTIRQKKFILTGSGTMYCQHDENMSVEWELVDDFTVLRSKYKDLKLEHINDDDKRTFNLGEIFQLTYKLLNNAFYGVKLQKDSFFYNIWDGVAITQTGTFIITTSINIFEKFLSGNFKFRNINDITIYVNNILNENYNIKDFIEEKYINDEIYDTLYYWLFDHCSEELQERENTEERICRILMNLSNEEMMKIYIKNNLYKQIEFNSNIKNTLKENLEGNEDLLDPNKVQDKYKASLEYLWDVFSTTVFYVYNDFYRYENCQYGKREVILTVDTDSCFLYLYKFFEYCKSNFNIKDESIYRLTSINFLAVILSNLIKNTYEYMTTISFNIKGEKFRKFIKMKNEFFYYRIMLTDSKKNYGGLLLEQEGKIFKNGGKIDIKGLQIKKVSTSKTIRNKFVNILEEDILRSEKIDFINIMKKYNDIEESIRQSILSGGLEYAIPGKVNEINSYVTPWQQQTVRGSVLWNKLFPDNPIQIPDKISFFKLSLEKFKNNYDIEMTDYEVFANVIYDRKDLTEEEQENIVETIKKNVFENDNVSKYGFSIICFPKTVKRLPDWLIDFIDIDKIIEDSMKPGVKVLESLNTKVLSYQVGDNKGKVMSNILLI